MLSHVSRHAIYLEETTMEHRKILGKLMTISRRLISKCLLNKIICTSKRKRIDTFITKRKKA